jgi:hypothetical protein
VIKRKEQKVNSQKGKCFMHIAKWKQSFWKGYILYHSNYTTF